MHGHCLDLGLWTFALRLALVGLDLVPFVLGLHLGLDLCGLDACRVGCLTVSDC